MIKTELSQTNETAIRTAGRLGADDAVSISFLHNEVMARFANNSLTVAKRIKETSLLVYLASKSRRIVGASSNPEESSVKRFVANLHASLMSLPKEANFAGLPETARKYTASNRYDKKIGELEDGISDLAQEAIESALSAGADRTAGAIEATDGEVHLLTLSGTEGTDRGSKILLNVRAFTDSDASGHGLSCYSTLRNLDPREAGRRAGDHAKRMMKSKRPEEGSYERLMGPTVASNLVSLMGYFASAFSVDAGTSYMAGKLNKKIASSDFTLKDHGQSEGTLEGRGFDDEGLSTQTTTIIEEGSLSNYLHNLTTAKKFGARSTGNAGWIEPHPWNLEVSPGRASYEEMVKETKRGIILTSNWYTRFTNYRTGEFSTVPRDGAYLVENGEVVSPLSGLRVSDNLERMFSSMQIVSKEREWIQWWEVDIPTLCPWILVDGVRVTRAYG